MNIIQPDGFIVNRWLYRRRYEEEEVQMIPTDRVAKNYRLWTGNPYFGEATRLELLQIQDTKEIEDRFYCDLEFGTAGIRGVLGAGTNRMNYYVVRKITQGLADVLLAQGEDACRRGVVIAYDSRAYSPEFARETAAVLNANGIKAYVFDALRPTPELSFAVRRLHTCFGVMITASHNPKEYNGYKVYGEDGGQLAPEQAGKIALAIERREDWQVPVLAAVEATAQGLWETVGAALDRQYLDEVEQQLLNRELSAQQGAALAIVYTPFHGAGRQLVEQVLAETGFSQVFTVPEQARPDPSFATVKAPNPEDPAAFRLALQWAQQRNADLIIGTDPDADRMGLYCRTAAGAYQRFSGNQIGVLLEYYLLQRRQELGLLPADGVVVKSIVSTALANQVAAAFGVRLMEVPVGFKFIGEQIKRLEETGEGTFLWGFEESLGFLAGSYCRDKDAVLAAALAAEAALYYRQVKGKTLDQVLAEIFTRFGCYGEEQVSFTLQGREGKQRIQQVMETLRQDQRTALAGLPLASLDDFAQQRSRRQGQWQPLDFPASDMLRFSLDDGSFVMARPSGTEPKIKFYFCVRGEDPGQAQERLAALREDFLRPVRGLLA